MKIVVIGGTGLIGSKTVAILREGGGRVEENSLVQLVEARLGRIDLNEWLRVAAERAEREAR